MSERNKNTSSMEDQIVDGTIYILNGSEFQAILQRYGLSYEQFGKLIGKSRYIIGRWASGECRQIKIKYAQKLEAILGKSIYRTVLFEYREKRRKKEKEHKKYLEERALRMNLKA